MARYQVRSIMVANTYMLLSFTLTLGFAGFLHSQLGEWNLTLLILLCGALHLWGLYFNHRRWYTVSKVLPVALIEVYVFIVASMFGRESSVHWLFIPIVFGVIQHFGRRERTGLWFTVALAVLCYAALEWTDFALMARPEATPELQRSISTVILLICVVVTVAIARFSRAIAKDRLRSQLGAQERLNAIFNHSFDAIFLVNPNNWIIRDCNPRALAMWEVENKMELVGKTLGDLCVRAPSVNTQNIIRDAVTADEIWEGKAEYLGAQGKRFWGSTAISQLFVGNSRPVMVRITDISEIEASRRALKKREYQLREVQGMANLGNSELDLSQRKAYWSDQLYEIFGLPRETEITMDTFGPLVHPDDRERVLTTLNEAVDKEEPFELEYRVIRPLDQREIVVRSRGKVLQGPFADPHRILASIQDVTEEKRAEAELMRARDEAEQANRFKTTFLANMSHEIRTPINGIMGFTELLKNTELDHDQREYLELIHSSGDTLLQLLNDLLDLNKIESGRMDMEHIDFAFDRMVMKALAPYQHVAREKGLTLEVGLAGDIPAYVNGDPVRIRQVLVNLVNNSVKFTREGGIAVRFWVEDTGSDNKVMLVGTVTDSGSGIPEEKQRHVFSSFTQADSSITRKYGGTGLGLSIVQQLLTVMGGSIGVVSPSPEPVGDTGGPGTQFHFSFPLVAGKETAPEKAGLAEGIADQLRFSRPYRILVAEDNRVNQLLANKVLTALGAQVELVENGKQALEVLAVKSVDAVVMDLQMPVMDGYEATRQLREKFPDLPVIALSANVFKDDIDRCREVGMQGHIGKPFSQASMYEILNDVLDPRAN